MCIRDRVTHGYDILVVSRRLHPRLASVLARLPGWRVVYSDRSGIVVERRSPEANLAR